MRKSRDRSRRDRGRSGRAPGKQPRAPSGTLKQSADPDEKVECGPAVCACCGSDLADAAVAGVQKAAGVRGAAPPPPKVIDYQVAAKACPGRGGPRRMCPAARSTGLVHARVALAVCGHYLPAAQATRLLAAPDRVSVPAQSAVRPRPGWGVHRQGPGAAAGGRGAVRRRDARPPGRTPACSARSSSSSGSIFFHCRTSVTSLRRARTYQSGMTVSGRGA